MRFNMKQFLAILIFTLPMMSNASTLIAFGCKSNDTVGVHRFDAKGIVSIDDYNKVEGVLSIQSQKAQADDSVQIFEEVKVSGTRQHFEGGKLSTKQFDQLILFPKDTYIKLLNLLVDFEVTNSSQLFSVDNFVYRADCYQVQL